MADEPIDIRQQKAGAVNIGGSIVEAYDNIIVGRDVVGRDKIISQTADQSPIAVDHSTAPIKGLGIWIGNITACEGGDPQRIAERALSIGLSHVVIDILDFGMRDRFLHDIIATAISAMKARGLQVWGWQHLRGERPEAESRIAVGVLNQLKPDGYIADVGNKFKQPGMDKAAEVFLRSLREQAPSLLISLSSFHYPSYHRELPWEILLTHVDFVVPQVYWEQAHNPGAQLRRSLDEYSRLTPARPVFPVGSAYSLSDWQPTPTDLADFIQTARELGLNGAALFSWDWLGQPENKELWNVLERMRWETVKPVEEQTQFAPPVEEAAAPVEEKKPPVEIQIPAPSFERQLIQIIRNDEVEKVEDHLGFEKYAEAFAQLVQDERTRPPLTVGISGAWGSGKSFLLYRLYAKLDELKPEPNPRWRWHRPWEPRTQKRAQIVRFNAWDYNATEAVWPGLVRGILETLEAGASPTQRALSRARRNLAREIGGVRDKLILGSILFVAVLTAFGYWASTLGDWQVLATMLGSLGGLAGAYALFKSLLDVPMAQWLTDLFKAKERTYGGALGYMGEIRDDIRELKTRLPAGAKVVVIIDDLDRCTADKIVDTLEAIKLLLSFDIFVVFLAVDSSVIARAVEKRYKDLLAEAGRSGYFYLDKIIQIPFRLPEPDPTTVSNYLFSLLRAADAPAKSTLPTAKAEALASLLAVRNSEATAFRAFLATLPDDAGAEAGAIAKEIKDRLAFNGLRKGLVDERIYLIGEVWALLARWWPVTIYTMHEALRAQSEEGQTPALAELARRAEEKAAGHIPTQRFREMVDAPLDQFKKAIAAAPPGTFAELRAALKNWVAPYSITIGFTPAELEAFQNLSPYLHKNPRHIKRLVNTYSLIRMLAARAPNGELILNAPETMLKWLIISSQWPFSSQAILQAFDDELETRRPGEPLPENDDALARLHQKAKERIAAHADLQKERARLDGDPDVLDKLVGDSLRTLTSRQLDLLRAYAINFNPAENSLPQSLASPAS